MLRSFSRLHLNYTFKDEEAEAVGGSSSYKAEENNAAKQSSSADKDPVPGDDDDQIDFDFVAAIAEYVSEWVESLDWDDFHSLPIFLSNLLLNVLEYQLLKDAAQVIGKYDRGNRGKSLTPTFLTHYKVSTRGCSVAE